MTSSEDRLAVPGTASGLIIVHHGDPAYPSRDGSGSRAAERLFLRLLAYLVFADRVAVPARYLLEGDAAFRAFTWASPLVRQGLLVPERRAGVDSFAELVVVRNLSELSHNRAQRLDAIVTDVREIHFDQLSQTYRGILDNDLAPNGAFRRSVSGGVRGRYVDALARAHAYHQEQGDGTPERFGQSVGLYAPKLGRQAVRWAMARYYVTPTLYDQINTREVPADAHALLAAGGVMDLAAEAFQDAAPVRELAGRLDLQLPAVPVEVFHREYCETVQIVRQRYPDARRVFADVREAARLDEAGRTLSEAFSDELARQQRIREPAGRRFNLGAGLVSGALSVPLAMPLDPAAAAAASVGFSAVASVAGGEVQRRRQRRTYERERPWVLAIEDFQRQTRRPSGL